MLKESVNSFYQLQKLRIQMGNRIVAAFKQKLGQEPSTPEEELCPESQQILKDYRACFKRIADTIATVKSDYQFPADSLITDFAELSMVRQYVKVLDAEETTLKDITKAITGHPVTVFAEKVKGMGVLMSAVIISEFDIHKCHYASTMWAYAGLDVLITEDGGEGRCKKEHHLVERTYLDKKGKEAKRMGITFNPFLKTKLVGVLGSCLLKANDPTYRPIYDGYKNRIENHPKHAEKTKAHRHNMAVRYMIKQLLVDLYKEWRTAEGLEVHAPYHEAKLGMVHHSRAA